MSTFYLGIDPGASGGLVALTKEGWVDSAVSMLKTERGIFQWFAQYAWQDETLAGFERKTYAVLEQVSGYIGKAHPGSAMFSFGQSYGGLRMALTGCEIRWGNKATPPRVWQKHFGVEPRGKKESKESFKRRLKEKAEELFPHEKVTLAISDALLLAKYCLHLYGK